MLRDLWDKYLKFNGLTCLSSYKLKLLCKFSIETKLKKTHMNKMLNLWVWSSMKRCIKSFLSMLRVPTTQIMLFYFALYPIYCIFKILSRF